MKWKDISVGDVAIPKLDTKRCAMLVWKTIDCDNVVKCRWFLEDGSFSTTYPGDADVLGFIVIGSIK